ncbi:hypothetical protein JCGZ_15436 [Jatropha curcas]|uniref:Dynamin GTPase domain-containing protein n=1 Tax=Jatropha curcas TaxID=180498 RepID=A0A067KGU2_JATCU|nr:hypothetical protein JCGZ_15436 [Jatropha curcas]
MGVSETPLSNGDEMENYEEVSSIALVRAKVEEDVVPLYHPTMIVFGLFLMQLISLSFSRCSAIGICTRVPPIMRLQHYPTTTPELFLEFNGKTVLINETHIANAINLVTDKITGNGKGISNTPLTLIVNNNGVHDLTMIDLPRITRVPVLVQPENIYEQIPARESLRKILVRGECDEYSDDHDLYCTSRLLEMLNEYSNDLHNCPQNDPRKNILVEEIWIVEESRRIELPKLLPRTAFLSMLQKKVEWILRMPIDFVEKVWTYIENVFSIQNLVNKELDNEIISELMGGCGGGLERMLEESPSVASKREKLNMRIKLLGESKTVQGNIMDKIATTYLDN